MFDPAPYQQAFHWVRCAYLDGPDTLSLTAACVHAACRVEVAVCAEVLDALARARFVVRREDGSYVRWAAATQQTSSDMPGRPPRAARASLAELPTTRPHRAS